MMTSLENCTFFTFLIFIICQGLVNFTWITFNIQFFFSLFKGFWKEQLWTVVHQLCKWNSAVFLQSVCLQNGTSEFGIQVLTRLCSKENSMEPSALKVWNPGCPHNYVLYEKTKFKNSWVAQKQKQGTRGHWVLLHQFMTQSSPLFLQNLYT